MDLKKFVVFLILPFLISNFSFAALSQTPILPMEGFFEWLNDVRSQEDNNTGKSEEEILKPLQQDEFVFYDLRSVNLMEVDLNYLLEILGKREITLAESLKSIPKVPDELELKILEGPTIDLENSEQSEAEKSHLYEPEHVVFLINDNTVFPIGFNLDDFECFITQRVPTTQEVCFSYMTYIL